MGGLELGLLLHMHLLHVLALRQPAVLCMLPMLRETLLVLVLGRRLNLTLGGLLGGWTPLLGGLLEVGGEGFGWHGVRVCSHELFHRDLLRHLWGCHLRCAGHACITCVVTS